RRHSRQRLRDVDRAHQDAAQARIEDLDEDRPGARLDGLALVLAEGAAHALLERVIEHDIARGGAVLEEALPPGLDVGEERRGAAFAARRERALQEGELHSTRST